jgi:hypothetical protein
MAISSVHRRSETHLVTLDAVEASRVSTKISNGDVQFLKSVAVADSIDFDELINSIKELTLISAPIIPTLRSGREVVNLKFANLEIEIDK